MKFQNKTAREIKDFSLLELLRNKENTLREGTNTILNPQIKIHGPHEIEPIANSKIESLDQSQA